jgi:hypothetical protein
VNGKIQTGSLKYRKCHSKLKSLVSGPVLLASIYRCGNELSSFIKSWEFFGQLSDYQLLKNGSTPGNYLSSVVFGFTLISLKIQNTL